MTVAVRVTVTLSKPTQLSVYIVCPTTWAETCVPEAPVHGPSPLVAVTVQEFTCLASHVTFVDLLLCTSTGFTVQVTISAGGGGRHRPAEQPADPGSGQVDGLPIGAPVHELTIVSPEHTALMREQLDITATHTLPCKLYPLGQVQTLPLEQFDTVQSELEGQLVTTHTPPEYVYLAGQVQVPPLQTGFGAGTGVKVELGQLTKPLQTGVGVSHTRLPITFM